jgi:hypothetical protein
MPKYALLIALAVFLYFMWSAFGPIAAAVATVIAIAVCFFARKLFRTLRPAN